MGWNRPILDGLYLQVPEATGTDERVAVGVVFSITYQGLMLPIV